MLKNTTLSICLLITVSMLFSCSYKSRNVLLKTPQDTDKISAVYVINEQKNTDDYYNKIAPEDELSIRNLQNKNYIVSETGPNAASNTVTQTITYRVDAEGYVKLPLIGRTKVAGLNRSEAAKLIQAAYEKTELNNPIIDVQIINLYVTLLGEVGKQGKYLIGRENTDLLDVLGEAGGFTEKANKKMLKIVRGNRTDPEVILVNLTDIVSLKNPKLKLRTGDVIYVEPRRIFSSSEGVQAYSTLIQVGLLVLNTVLIIYNLSK